MLIVTFRDLDLGLWSEVQQKAKQLSFIFSYSFQMIMTEFGVAVKQIIKLNSLMLHLIEINVCKGNNYWGLFFSTSKNLNVGMYIDCSLVW